MTAILPLQSRRLIQTFQLQACPRPAPILLNGARLHKSSLSAASVRMGNRPVTFGVMTAKIGNVSVKDPYRPCLASHSSPTTTIFKKDLHTKNIRFCSPSEEKTQKASSAKQSTFPTTMELYGKKETIYSNFPNTCRNFMEHKPLLSIRQ